MIAYDFWIRTILADQIRWHQFRRLFKKLVDSLDDSLVKSKTNFKPFKIDVWSKSHQSVLQLVDDSIHEHEHLVIMVLDASNTLPIAFKLWHVLI